MIAYDTAAMFLALWLAFSARLGLLYWPTDPRILYLALGSVVCGLGAMFALGLYRIVVRYFDVDAALPVALASGGAAAAWLVLAYFSRIDGLPRSVGGIYFGLLFMLLFFGRIAVSRFILPSHGVGPVPVPSADAVPSAGVAIYGANPTGLSLAESLRRHPEHQLRFFISDSPMLVGRKMAGHRIRPLSQLASAVKSGEVQKVLLATPAATRGERLATVQALSKMAVQVLTIPSPDEIMSGRYTLSDIRPINVDDLLKRDIVPPIRDLIEPGIERKSILVTGAGGSIGSEICRQVVGYGPVRLVMLDHSEFALYRIEREIRQACQEAGTEIEIVPVVGSLLNRRLVETVLRRWRVDTVFHAAAYKHVPLIEQNEVAGVENNVFGTKILADACVAARIARLTMISTDKAVRPTNVMGASKRVAELYIQALARLPDTPTRFGMVRFGNVLDSSGSVVEQFRDQIRKGGPVTVTDPEITRFFMSIPEATQLVLQANSLAEGGDVFVLDMGEPVKIADLAKTMIALAGMTERTSENKVGDIEITYVGLRPGEKLHEELFVGDASEDTVHPQIKMARERCLPIEDLGPVLQRLQAALEAQDPAAVRIILEELLEKDHERAAPPVAASRTDARVA